MACSLNQRWLLVSEVLWSSPENNFTVGLQAAILYIEFENYIFKITASSPRGELVKESFTLCNHSANSSSELHTTQTTVNEVHASATSMFA